MRPTVSSLSAGAAQGERGKCRVIGVVNVTPDSFSDGGRFATVDKAVAHGLRLRDEGADLVDVGGESTRPGAARVTVEEELSRVVPVVRELAGAGVTVSVDTMRAAVAESALEAGASLVNDVSGGLADPEMARVVAALGVPYVVMHWRGHSKDMQRRAVYGDVVSDVVAELSARLDALTSAGVQSEQIIVDPGIGFAKTAAHNWCLLAGLERLHALGRPLLVGASRKAFLGELLAGPHGPRPSQGREAATVAVTTYAALHGAWGVRVHSVAANADAVRAAAAIGAAARVERADLIANAGIAP
ncbi:MAG: dihydropteroate synthase [Actinomycetota bacterium]|nr:dihydropteroate synthase [Actinomycetota bacterium]